MTDLVRMSHPDHGAAGPVSRYAFEKIWQPKGWVLVEDDGSSPAPRRRSSRPKKEES